MANETGLPLQLRDATLTFADGGAGGAQKTYTFRISEAGAEFRTQYDADDVESRDHTGALVCLRDGPKMGLPYLRLTNTKLYDLGNGVTLKALANDTVSGWVDTNASVFPDAATGTLTLTITGADGGVYVWTGARLKKTGLKFNVVPNGTFVDLIHFDSGTDASDTPT